MESNHGCNDRSSPIHERRRVEDHEMGTMDERLRLPVPPLYVRAGCWIQGLGDVLWPIGGLRPAVILGC
jgi:hypothetical protein